MDNDKLRTILQSVDTENCNANTESPADSINPVIIRVMTDYQNANRWLDIIKEDLLINKGLTSFSEYIHNLAHTMPVRFDKFGDILHTKNILVPYPPTTDIPYVIASLEDVSGAVISILSNISNSLRDFIKLTQDTPYHSMACKSEELLTDIDSEFENIHRMLKILPCCNSTVEFDEWISSHMKRGD